jgi:hypothetical protein
MTKPKTAKAARTPAEKPLWTYSAGRAILRKNGKPFAIVTPAGVNALPARQARELLIFF